MGVITIKKKKSGYKVLSLLKTDKEDNALDIQASHQKRIFRNVLGLIALEDQQLSVQHKNVKGKEPNGVTAVKEVKFM